MKIIKQQLSGSSISQISDLSSLKHDEMLSGDLFLISQQALSNVSPDRVYEFNDKIYHNEYRSMKERYCDLSNRFFNDSKSLFGFKSMAWENQEHYSLIDHIHNYSKTSCISNFKLGKPYKSEDLSNIVTFNIDNKNTILYMPRIRIYEQPRPYIGQLKFMAIPTLQNKPNDVNFYKSSSFDGWVYPDGREISANMFIEAYQTFGESYGSTNPGISFKIPDLRNFIKGISYDGQNGQQNLTSLIPYQNNLSIHTHSVDNMSVSGEISVNLSIHLSETHDKTKPAAIHDSNGSDAFIDGYFEFGCQQLTCTESRILNSDSNLDGETYPTHNLLPVLIYIGEINE